MNRVEKALYKVQTNETDIWVLATLRRLNGINVARCDHKRPFVFERFCPETLARCGM